MTPIKNPATGQDGEADNQSTEQFDYTAESQQSPLLHWEYNEAGMPVFPLHRIITGTCTAKGKEENTHICTCTSGAACTDPGKHPAINGWQQSRIRTDEEMEALDSQLSTGFGVVPVHHAIIDIDPRNGGDESLHKLLEDHPGASGLLSAGAIVQSGRGDGGRHLYFKMPDTGKKYSKKISLYPGIDFLIGPKYFAVGAGSLHASTGKPYQLVEGSFSDLSEVPACILGLLEEPKLEAVHGEQQAKCDLPIEEVEKALRMIPRAELDPDEYEQWVKVGMALHHATGGGANGFQLWGRWSKQSAKFTPSENRKKWQSFKTDPGRRAVTVRTILALAEKAGYEMPEGYDRNGTKIRTYKEIIESTYLLDPDTDPAIIEALVVETRTAKLTPVQRRQVFERIKSKTKMPLSVLKEVFNASGEGEEPDHLELARAVLDQVGKDNLLSDSTFFWVWDPCGVWRKMDERAIKNMVQNIIVDKTEIKAAIVASVVDVLKSDVYRWGHVFNVGDPETVNCPNGEVSLDPARGWILKPHRREHYRTTQIPVAYDPNATAPRFSQYLDEIFQHDPDAAEKKQVILEMMGYSLMAHCRHEKFIILIGNGANGKSVLIKVIEGLIGKDSIAAVQPSEFNNKFQRGHLHSKLVNLVSEVKEGAVLDDDALKGIVSGETYTAEHKNKDPFQVTPFCTCWFGTNHMPKSRDFSEGLFRRTMLIEFNNKFEPWMPGFDPLLKEKLMCELPGILKMALDAYANVATTHTFTQPESMAKAVQEWRTELDQIARFLDAVRFQRNIRHRAQDTFEQYLNWARTENVKNTLGMPEFKHRMKNKGFEHGRDAHGSYFHRAG